MSAGPRTGAAIPSEPTLRLGFVDGLRAIAILGVALVHTAQHVTGLPDGIRSFATFGQYGVQLFFVASAFTLFLSLHQRTLMDRRPVVSFFVRRIFRIIPMYWLALAFYQLLQHVRPESVLGDAAPGAALANLAFIHEWHPRWISGAVTGGWSVGVEMSFYLVLPLLFVWITTLRRAILFFAVAMVVHIASAAIVNAALLSQYGPAAPQYIPTFTYHWLPAQLPVFALGIILFFVLKRRLLGGDNVEPAGTGRRLLLLAGSLGVLAALVLLGARPQRFAINWGHIIAGVAFLLLAAGLSSGRNWLVTNRAMRYLGMVSYSAYLTHFVALAVCWRALVVIERHTIILAPAVNLLLLFLATLAVTVAMSTVTYRFIEKPGIALGKRLIERLEAGGGERQTSAAQPAPVKTTMSRPMLPSGGLREAHG